MSNLISRALLSGVGFANLTKDAIVKTAEDLVNRSKLSEEEGRRLVKDFQKRSADTQRELERRINSVVGTILANLKPSKAQRRSKRSKATVKVTVRRKRRRASGARRT